jgi:hypothetical protein
MHDREVRDAQYVWLLWHGDDIEEDTPESKMLDVTPPRNVRRTGSGAAVMFLASASTRTLASWPDTGSIRTSGPRGSFATDVPLQRA